MNGFLCWRTINEKAFPNRLVAPVYRFLPWGKNLWNYGRRWSPAVYAFFHDRWNPLRMVCFCNKQKWFSCSNRDYGLCQRKTLVGWVFFFRWPYLRDESSWSRKKFTDTKSSRWELDALEPGPGYHWIFDLYNQSDNRVACWKSFLRRHFVSGDSRAADTGYPWNSHHTRRFSARMIDLFMWSFVLDVIFLSDRIMRSPYENLPLWKLYLLFPCVGLHVRSSALAVRTLLFTQQLGTAVIWRLLMMSVKECLFNGRYL